MREVEISVWSFSSYTGIDTPPSGPRLYLCPPRKLCPTVPSHQELGLQAKSFEETQTFSPE